MTDPAFPFPALGLVHVANELTVAGPLPLDGSLDVEVHAGAVRPHPHGRVVDLVTSVRCNGRPAWTGTSTYLRRGRPAVGSGNPSAPTEPGVEEVPSDAAAEPEGPPLHLSARRRLGADLGRRYAAVSGDLNPIHLSALTARPLGFPRAIAHGMWTAAAVLGCLQGRLPDVFTYTVQFRRPITLPATVDVHTGLGAREIVAQVRGRDGRVHLDAVVAKL
ncbi:MAG TPA: MaoC/PaaZ C-terminal domain-containing protein [Kineosporiaceae bacterium]|nr:MaoC/PaaZ C-terminal domain-containing protein [Kineosporiaceae bacterium]